MWCLCAIALFGTSLSAQSLRAGWYDISFAEFHERYAFSEFDHALIDVFAAQHQAAKSTSRTGGSICGLGFTGFLLSLGAEEPRLGVAAGFTGLGIGSTISLLGNLHKIGYSKRSLYLYLHEERKIPAFIHKQIQLAPVPPTSIGLPARV
jgi:hypothetical protein